MKKKTFKSEVITTVAISITLGMLTFQLLRLEPPTIESTAIPMLTAIHIDSVERFQSSIVPVDVQPVEIQNTEPVPSILYNIPLSDGDQLLIREISNQFGIDYELILAIIKTESEFNPNDIGDNGHSFGLMQIQQKYWTKMFNVNGCSDWLSVKDNVTTGCAILQYLS